MRKAVVLAGLLALSLGATAGGASSCIGPLCVSSTATMMPRELPKSGGVPISLSSITRVSTKDGSTPPTLAWIDFLIDKHGRGQQQGLPRLHGGQARRDDALAGAQALRRGRWSARGAARRW